LGKADEKMKIKISRREAKETIRGCLKSQFDCHIEFIEILTIKLIAFDKLRLTTLLRQPLNGLT
jgi:DNA-dependent RNA polymerase auxiliary subunit epsilon